MKYEGFEKYKDYLNFEALNNLDKIFNLLNQKDIVKKINEELNITNTDDGKTYSFIPVYDYEKHALVPTSGCISLRFANSCWSMKADILR